MDTWEECHASGMTAIEAADQMGKSHVAAYKWAKKHGVSWRTLSPEEVSARIRAGQSKRRAVPYNGMGEKRNDAKAIPPAQHRIGGRFWMVNLKTGERINKASSGAIYLHASLMGWTDWNWGQDQ